MMNTQEQLQAVFRDNFVAYYRSHVAHVNIQGRNFYSDHKLLGNIYEDLQSQIDVLAELIRSVGDFMPNNLQGILVDSGIDDEPVSGTDMDLLETVRANLVQLVTCYQELCEVSDEEEYEEICNYAQERVLALNKFLWMLDSTLTPQQ